MQNYKKLNLHNVRENVVLAPFTTFRIGGQARFFIVAKTGDEVVEAVEYAKSHAIPFFILGGGSNILVSDNGFSGLVIKIECNDFRHEGKGRVVCRPGLITSRLIQYAKKEGLGGIEFMAGIPGTVGAAVYGNAGAWGRGFGEVVNDVEVYRDKKIFHYSYDEMEFHYRESVLKKHGGVIINTTLHLTPRDPKDIEKDVLEIIRKRAKLKIEGPNAGCVFKNIDLSITPIDKEKIKKALDITEEEFIEATKHGKLPIGYIIDKLGLKRKRIGGAQVSECHGAYIANVGGAKAEDVVMLMSFIKTKVRNLLGIQLREEVQMVGF